MQSESQSRLVLNCTDAASLLALWWKAVFLAPVWGYLLLPVYGALCGVGGVWGNQYGLVAVLPIFWLYFIQDLLYQRSVVNGDVIKRGFRTYQLSQLTSLGTEYKANKALPANLVFTFKSGPGFKLRLSRLRSHEYERLLHLVTTANPQCRIDPVLNTLAQCKKVAKPVLGNDADGFTIRYHSHRRLVELKETFSIIALTWLRYGPAIAAVVLTPFWINSISTWFGAFRFWNDPNAKGARLVADWLTNAVGKVDSAIAELFGKASIAVYNAAIHPAYLALSIMALGAIIYCLMQVVLRPTVVSISANGLSLNFACGNWSMTLHYLDWTSLSTVSLKKVETPLASSWQMRFEGAFTPVDVDLAYLDSVDRQRLLKAIERHAPQCSIDTELAEAMAPKQEHSYTELWLQSLSNTPDRDKLQPLAPSQRLHDDRYKVIRRLGVGGQGIAYLCKDEKTSQEVVLKETLIPVFAEQSVKDHALKRFEEEADLLRKMKNDRIVGLIDSFYENNRAYLVLEHINGVNLRKIVQESGPLAEGRVRELAKQMCEILKYLHANSIIHRDFTPDNLILTPEGILKLIDFNVAQSTQVGATGTIAGKHAFLPPEQFRGKATPQSDIYALGATLHFLLVGSDPEAISCSSPRQVKSDVSADLDELVRHCTEPNTEKRIKDVETIEKQLYPATAKNDAAGENHNGASEDDAVVLSTKVPEKQKLEA
jgi:tRNA A-37 threonylcarbamoyl transferase component Bud32